MGKRKKRTTEFCFMCQELMRSLRRHHVRKHGGILKLWSPSPFVSTRVSPTSDGAQPPTPKRLKANPVVTEAEEATLPSTNFTTDETEVLPSPSLTDHWVEHVTIDVPKEGPPAPTAVPSPPRQAVQALPEPDRGENTLANTWMKHQATQADGCPWEIGRVIRQVLTKVTHLTVIEPPLRARDQRLTNSEREFTTRLPANQQRWLCDCESCIGQALELALQQHPTEQNFTPGIRFLTLPV